MSRSRNPSYLFHLGSRVRSIVPVTRSRFVGAFAVHRRSYTSFFIVDEAVTVFRGPVGTRRCSESRDPSEFISPRRSSRSDSRVAFFPSLGANRSTRGSFSTISTDRVELPLERKKSSVVRDKLRRVARRRVNGNRGVTKKDPVRRNRRVEKREKATDVAEWRAKAHWTGGRRIEGAVERVWWRGDVTGETE